MSNRVVLRLQPKLLVGTIAALLTQDGVAVERADDFAGLLSLCEAHRPRVVVLSPNAELHDPWSEARLVHGALPRTHVIALVESSEAIMRDRTRAYRAGVRAVVSLGENPAALRAAVTSAVPKLPPRDAYAPSQVPRLTGGQMDVLGLAAVGHRTSEISRRLALSEAAVHERFRQVARKLDATSRSHSVARALQLGILGSKK